MPALKLFNQRTLVGGDDIQLVSIITIFFRMAQFACCIPLVLYMIHSYYDQSSSSELVELLLLTVYVVSVGLFTFYSIHLEFVLIRMASVSLFVCVCLCVICWFHFYII